MPGIDKKGLIAYFYFKFLTHDYIHNRLDGTHHVWGQDPQRGLERPKWLFSAPGKQPFYFKSDYVSENL